MAITIKHAKTDNIADWTQVELDAQIALGNFPPGTVLADIVLPSDWNNDHTFTGTLGVSNGGTGATTLTGYVKGNGTSAFTASSTVPSTDITGLGTMSTQNANSVSITGGSISGTTVSGYIPTTDRGIANGVASLDGSGTVPVSQLPAAVLGALSYQGTWNASTNTPTLTSSVGTKGYYYVVNVAGSTNLNGITDWQVGDWAVYNGSAWQKIDNTDAVTSVNGYTGTVVLTQTDISGTVPTSRTITAGTGLTGGGDLSANRTLAIDSTVATLTGTQTLTNKTLTAPKVDLINDTNGNEILGFSPTTSATDYLVVKNGIGVGVPLHIYADGSSTNTGLHIQPKGTGLVTISDGTDFNKGIRFRSSSSAASAITLLDAVSTAGRVVTLPDATTTLVGRDTTDTLTNKSISGTTNTLSNIGNAALTNSSITINGSPISLGGSVSVGTVTSVTGTSPIASSGGATPAISISQATTSTNGYLSSTDWNTFNDKQPAGTYVTSVGATSPVTSSGGTTPTIAMPAATTSVSGYLTSTDWTTFNNKGSGTVTSVSGTTGRITSTGGNTPVIDLASGVATAGTTGSSTLIPVVTIDTYGRVTSITTASNPQGTVTSVTGTAPVVSSGGATPAISMAAANTTTNGYLTSTDWNTFNGKGSGTVTSVAALTLGTTGTDLSSTVATGTTTPVITLQVPTASASNRGALSSTDWTTFNNKAPAVTYTSTYVPYGQGTTTPALSSSFTYNSTTGSLTAPEVVASNGIFVNNMTIAASYTIPTGYGASSVGAVTINSGVTVTVPSGSRWVVL